MSKTLTVTNRFGRALRNAKNADLMVKLLNKYYARKRNTNAK
jgi:hypothetical protein